MFKSFSLASVFGLVIPHLIFSLYYMAFFFFLKQQKSLVLHFRSLGIHGVVQVDFS